MIDENSGQYHRANLDALVERAVIGQRLNDVGAETTDRSFLDKNQHVVRARQLQREVNVKRLEEAGIGDRGRQAVRFKFIGSFETYAEPCTEREPRHLAAFAQATPLTDFERHADIR